LAGLSAASSAAANGAETVLLERLPAIGGLAGWEDSTARRLDAAGRAAGVRQLLGTTAIRWELTRVLVAAPGRIEWVDADRLVFAGGTRPATPGELRLAGDRPAGVLSATVAEHLIGARVTLGHRPIVFGVSHWAELVARRMRDRGVRVVALGLPGDARPVWADEWLGTAIPRSVRGRPRIAALEVERDAGRREWLSCDAVVLSAPAKPIRNVEGAVRGGAGVLYVQETDLGAGPLDIVRLADAMTAALVKEAGRTVT
jgi:hypothetical protein